MIQWAEFALVLGVALAATVVITLSYAGFIRLQSVATADGTTAAAPAPMAAAIVCLAIGIAAVLFGLWVIIPQFHGS